MEGEKDLDNLLKTLKPKLNIGEYVFCTIDDLEIVNPGDILFMFKEEEGITVVVKKETANKLHLVYSFVASWITLTVHSSLAAVGLTAAFSTALSEAGISCNVVAAFYHDHIFVDQKDAERSIQILNKFSE